MTTELKKVEMFTDGACSGNPGPGGYGVILRYNNVEKTLSGGEANTTNNRMELLATITGFEALKSRCAVTVYTDSQYVVNGITKGWAEKWKANGWMRGKNQPAQNPDLWDRLLAVIKKHQVEFVWVKGHAGHPENERCDHMAVAESEKFK